MLFEPKTRAEMKTPIDGSKIDKYNVDKSKLDKLNKSSTDTSEFSKQKDISQLSKKIREYFK